MGIVLSRNLFAVVMLAGAYSLLSAGLFVVMDAVDVAFTEAAVGAGVSTVLMLGTLAVTTSMEKPEPLRQSRQSAVPLLVVIATGAGLVYGTLDMPQFGDATAPAFNHVAPYYIAQSMPEIGVPNIVTSVLASYRGFDTLGEVGVIFTAGIGVMLLITRRGNILRQRRLKSDGSKPQTADKAGDKTGDKA